MRKTNKKGFTIVELVIVIAVIAILASILIPTFSGVIGEAGEAAVASQARNIYTEYTAAQAKLGEDATDFYFEYDGNVYFCNANGTTNGDVIATRGEKDAAGNYAKTAIEALEDKYEADDSICTYDVKPAPSNAKVILVTLTNHADANEDGTCDNAANH